MGAYYKWFSSVYCLDLLAHCTIVAFNIYDILICSNQSGKKIQETFIIYHKFLRFWRWKLCANVIVFKVEKIRILKYFNYKFKSY